MSAPAPARSTPRADPSAPEVDVLIPTRNRPVELATTLAGLAAQEHPFDVVISDQSDGPPSFDTPPAQTMLRVLRAAGHRVRTVVHPARHGVAEHRAALLARSTARYALFLDDDIWLEPGTVARLHEAIAELGCGLVGAAMQGVSFLHDRRPAQLAPFERWEGWDVRAVAVTLGARGAAVRHRHRACAAAPAPAVAETDPCGAGDHFAGGVAARLAAGATVDEAVADAVPAPRTCLLVLVNSDGSARRRSGAAAAPLAERVAALAALDGVDGVVPFEADDPRAVLDALRPDLWAKGGDHDPADLPETPLVRQEQDRGTEQGYER